MVYATNNYQASGINFIASVFAFSFLWPYVRSSVV